MSDPIVDPQRRYTEEEYLAIDAAAPAGVRYEYTNGYITPQHGYEDDGVTAMAGASAAHAQIVAGVITLLRNATRGRDCRIYSSDLRVKARTTRSYKYPDVSALCGRPEFEATRPESLLNPSVLVEVLSPSTAAEDRDAKFAHYKRIQSLAEYLLVAQHEMKIERYLRAGTSWMLDEFTRPDDVVDLPSLGCALRIGDVYEGVDLPDEPPPPRLRLLHEAAAPAYAARYPRAYAPADA